VRRYPPRAPQNPSGAWSANRDRATQARFRTAVLANAGHQCQYTDGHYGRCPATTTLQAHHTMPGNNDPATGVALCRTHHRVIDPKAR
jgi:predicted restriction endonuclease